MQEPETQRKNAAKEMELFDYLEVIVKRKKLIFWVTVAAFVASIIIALILPKSYQSTAKILPPPLTDRENLTELESLANGLMDVGTPADLYASILQSEVIKDKIIDRFNLKKVYDVTYRQDLYKKLDKLVNIEAGRKDGIISITVEDKVPQRAADMANAYVEEVGNLNVNLNIYGAGQNRAFLEGRLAKAKSDLALAENALKAFQARSKAFQVPGQAETTIAGIAQMKARLASQEVRLSVLRTTYTDSSEEVTNALTSIANLKSQISRLENGNSSGALPSLGSVPALGQENVRLIRELNIQSALVEDLTKRYEQASLYEANNISSIKVIQKARVPDKKAKPRRTKIVIFSTIFAFMCSTGAAIAREHFDRLPSDAQRRIINLIQMSLSWIPFKKRK
jgi:tyrosine-protein kinase Etk/Wzc